MKHVDVGCIYEDGQEEYLCSLVSNCDVVICFCPSKHVKGQGSLMMYIQVITEFMFLLYI